MQKLSKQCLQCGKTIIKPYNESLTNWHTRHRFCSRACSMKYNRIGAKTQFKKGQKALNPIKKGQHISPRTQFKKGHTPWNKGKRCPERSGEKNNLWKGGIYLLYKTIRHLPEYKKWVESVFQRDDWTCQECGKRGGEKHAHHIKLFALILRENQIKTVEEALNCKELWDISNGITLCDTCHSKKPEHSRGIDYKTRRKRQPKHYEPKICVVCGKEFTKRINEASFKWEKRQYCSHKCYWSNI